MYNDIFETPEGNIRGRAQELKRLGLYSPIFHLPRNYPDEEWRMLLDYMIPNILDGYYISNYGEVFSSRKGAHMMIPHESYDGYLRIGVRLQSGSSYTINIHRLVMLAFNYFDGCRDLQVNHIDGNKHNNYIGNLEWCTCAENIHHAVENGLQHHNHGEDCSYATITNAQADEVGRLLAENRYKHKDIASMVGVSKKVVDNIANGTAWKDVHDKYYLDSIIGHYYNGIGPTDEQLEKMCQYMEKNAPNYTSLGSLFTAMLNDLFGIKYDRYTMCPTLRRYFHGHVRKYITGKYHPKLGSNI